MQEIIHYAKFTFSLLLTPYGIVAFLILLGLYAIYLFVFEKTNIAVSTVAKLIAYPFMLTYGILMLIVANLLEKSTVQRLGLFIILIPAIISFAVSLLKDIKTQIDT